MYVFVLWGIGVFVCKLLQTYFHHVWFHIACMVDHTWLRLAIASWFHNSYFHLKYKYMYMFVLWRIGLARC